METKSPLEGLTPGAVQTFEAASMRDALASVKQAFGKDAIILKQEQLELGVFVTATDDLRVAQAWVDQQSDAAPRVDAKQDSQAGAPDHSSPASVVIKEPVTPPAAALGSSASDGFELLDAPVLPEPSGSERRQIPLPALGSSGGFDVFQMAGFEEFSHLSGAEEIRPALCARLSACHNNVDEVAGIYRFLGVSGAGKTAALMGLMIELLKVIRGVDVAVVNTDLGRAGGSETLHLNCQVFGVDYFEASSDQLQDCLDSLRARRVVLVDTAGLDESAADRYAIEPLSQYGRCLDVWVAGAHMSAAYLERQLHKLRVSLDSPLGICVTHVDGCVEVDVLLAQLWRWRIDMLGSTQGPGHQPHFALFQSEAFVQQLGQFSHDPVEQQMNVGPVPEVNNSGSGFNLRV